MNKKDKQKLIHNLLAQREKLTQKIDYTEKEIKDINKQITIFQSKVECKELGMEYEVGPMVSKDLSEEEITSYFIRLNMLLADFPIKRNGRTIYFTANDFMLTLIDLKNDLVFIEKEIINRGGSHEKMVILTKNSNNKDILYPIGYNREM